MVTIESTSGSLDAEPDDTTVALFQAEWNAYRKVVENNVLFHREAYGHLRRLLIEEVNRPFRFLDIACGDASASAGALRGTQVTQYRGVDFSAAALELAAATLSDLGCPVILEERDFREALAGRGDLADVIWIGLSLHHLQRPEKLAFLRELRGALAPGGRLMIYEDAGPVGDTRAKWLARWDLQRPAWAAFSEAEWNLLRTHVNAADYPEPADVWVTLGRDAGFSSTREIYVTPSDLFRLYCFDTEPA
jgi:SAM-dependent methyltransferase